MNERVVALRVGIVVLAAAFLTGLLVVLLGEGQSLWRSSYTIYLMAPRAPGVSVDTPVRKHGILIGRVTEVEFEDRGVKITAQIDGHRRIYGNDVCHIRSSSLLGDAVLEFVPVPDPQRESQVVQENEVIGNVVVATDPLEVLTNLEPDVRRAVQSFDTAAQRFGDLSASLQRAFGTDEDRVQRMMIKSEAAIDKFTVNMDTINRLVGDEEVQAGLRRSLKDFPETMQEMRATMSQARESLASFQAMSEKADKNLTNLQRFTGPLGDQGEELVTNMNSILRNLDVMSEEVAALAQGIRSSDGSLAKLIRDDELYDKFNATIDNLNDASRRLRPVLDNLRVFSDKIATDPRQLGVKGAIDSKPIGVGLKGVPYLREPRIQWPEEE